jgi:Universal stress protein family.
MRRTSSSTRRARSASRTACAYRPHRAHPEHRPGDRDEAIRRESEIIVMAGPRRVQLQRGRRQIFGDAVDFVLRHAPCRVMVATPRERAA